VTQYPRTIRVSPTLYPRSALLEASEAFHELCDVSQEEAPPDILLTISPHEGAPPEIVDEFLSYALSAALEIHLSEAS
jgi:hypothetical protein